MDWNELLVNVLTAVITIAVPVLAKFAVDWLSAKAKEAVAAAEAWKPDLMDQIESAALFAVKAAEKMGLLEDFAEFYVDKKTAAIAIAESYLKTYGFEEVDLDLLVAAIEKAVLENFPH